MTSLQSHREEAGLTQTELAARAGVSRQSIGAIESGRHLPRVDAALALAAALEVGVDDLFGSDPVPVDVISGVVVADGSSVRIGRVGERLVTAPARVGTQGWDVADGTVAAGVLHPFGRHASGLVVAGCEPGLEVLERLLREGGMGAVAAAGSSATAVAALEAGRVHAAVVHGPQVRPVREPRGVTVERFRVAQWYAGLAAPGDAVGAWWDEALSGRVPVVQREKGAGVQRAFEEAVEPSRLPVPGPRVGSHLEAARRAMVSGVPAVTIEPAALAMGAAFHPLESHVAQLWVATEWLNDRVVTEALNVMVGQPFQARLAAVGGYDLAGSGTRLP
jgi:DNA-binding XRE family transcriptional regulator